MLPLLNSWVVVSLIYGLSTLELGKYAEQDHVGTTKHFIESGYTEWFIPVSKVNKALSFPLVEIQGMQFYIAHGQEPNHFLQDAEFKTRDTNIEAIEKQIYEMLKGVCK